MAALPACSSYQLQGKVVQGPVSSVTIVDKSDRRLAEPGLSGATLSGTLDPQSPGRKRLSPAGTDGDGAFAIPITEAGAGFLEYDLQLIAKAAGFQSAVGNFRVPGGGKRVLITLAPGRDAFNPEQSDVVGETLRLSEPFLRE